MTVLCRIRLFPTFISKIKWLGCKLPLNIFIFLVVFKIIISADQLVRAQQESTRLRERLSDFDFFKARVEELQKENSNLYDARAALETEIAANRIRLAGMNDQVRHQK